MPDAHPFGQARLTRISLVQQGVISQHEFAKFVMIGSGGRVELAAPLTDQERRDFEIHVHGQYGSALAVQVKSALQLVRRGKSNYLQIYFAVRASRVVNDPLYWYFFAYLDPRSMGFGDPTFLIPSPELHEHASPKKQGQFWNFTLEASMEPGSNDHWRPYRVNSLDLGKKVLAIMRESKLQTVSGAASQLTDVPDLIWLLTS